MSITSKNGFRAFLIVSTLIGFGGLVDVIFPSLLSPELQEYFAKAEITNYGKFLAAYSFIMSIIGLVSFIGILKFRKWARSLYVILTIVGLLFTLLH
jgi:succinate-acetate transporter protein